MLVVQVLRCRKPLGLAHVKLPTVGSVVATWRAWVDISLWARVAPPARNDAMSSKFMALNRCILTQRWGSALPAKVGVLAMQWDRVKL